MAIWTVGRFPLQEVVFHTTDGCIYAPPRWTIVLDQILDKLGDRRPVVIFGDFNAWAVEKGSQFQRMQPAGSSTQIELSERSTSTYRRYAFCSVAVARNMNWRVSKRSDTV